MKPKDGLTRRDLIRNAGLAGAAAATGGLVATSRLPLRRRKRRRAGTAKPTS